MARLDFLQYPVYHRSFFPTTLCLVQCDTVKSVLFFLQKLYVVLKHFFNKNTRKKTVLFLYMGIYYFTMYINYVLKNPLSDQKCVRYRVFLCWKLFNYLVKSRKWNRGYLWISWMRIFDLFFVLYPRLESGDLRLDMWMASLLWQEEVITEITL